MLVVSINLYAWGNKITPPILASGELTVTADLYLALTADCEMKIILLVVDYIYPFHEEIFMQFVIF